MKRLVLALPLLAAVLASPAPAGVIMTMTTTTPGGQETGTHTVYAQSERIRMDDIAAGREMSMIFRDDRIILLEHAKKEYYVVDEAMLEQVGSQVSAAMQEMEKQLAQLPPEQRAMAERMMKGRMQGMGMAQAEPPPPPRVEKGAADTWGAYSCRRYTVYEGPEKTEEICAASSDQIDGAEELVATFRRLAAFLRTMSDSLGAGPMAKVARSPIDVMDQVDGVPVHSVQFENGRAVRETSLRSTTTKALEDALFDVPAGYARRDAMQGR